MQLPFVLQSAETMKAAVGYLEPFMERIEGQGERHRRARYGARRCPRHRQEPGRHHPDQQRLIASSISASKQPIGAILDAAVEHPRAWRSACRACFVKSTVVMRENLEEMTRLGLDVPVDARRRRPDPGAMSRRIASSPMPAAASPMPAMPSTAWR